MKKTYLQPQAVIYNVKAESVLETASIINGAPLTEGTYKGESKESVFDDFE